MLPPTTTNKSSKTTHNHSQLPTITQKNCKMTDRYLLSSKKLSQQLATTHYHPKNLSTTQIRPLPATKIPQQPTNTNFLSQKSHNNPQPPRKILQRPTPTHYYPKKPHKDPQPPTTTNYHQQPIQTDYYHPEKNSATTTVTQ